MRLSSLIAAIGALTLAAASSASGQRGQAAANDACVLDKKATWYVGQLTWFDESKATWTNDTLRTKLLAAAGLKTPLLAPVEWGWHLEGRDSTVRAADSAGIALLQGVGRGGWPGKSSVGAAATHAAYVLALRDTALTRRALHPFMEAGPDESPAPDVAVLEDRVRLAAGRKQLYGTQFRMEPSGSLSLLPMEDSAHADLRREGALLPPFALSACQARAYLRQMIK